MKKDTHPHFLGELESEIMEIVWDLRQATVRQVLNRLRRHRPVAYTTVMTVMARLHRKGVLERRPAADGAYVYAPLENRQEFYAGVSKRFLSHLISRFGGIAVAQFIEIIEHTDYRQTEAWKKALKKIR